METMYCNYRLGPALKITSAIHIVEFFKIKEYDTTYCVKLLLSNNLQTQYAVSYNFRADVENNIGPT